MKISNNKTKATMIALFLTLTIAVTLVISPTAKAHTPPVDVPTWCYIGVSNRVLGVSQQQLIVFWINSQPPTGSGNYGDRWTFTVEVTKPDGSKDTLGPFISDPVGGFYALYTPTAVGTYSAVAKFAQHKIDFTPNGQPPDWSPFSFGFSSVGDTYLSQPKRPGILHRAAASSAELARASSSNKQLLDSSSKQCEQRLGIDRRKLAGS